MKRSSQPPVVPLLHPGSPEASAMMDSVLAEYNWPANTKNAARAGYEAARRLAVLSHSAVPQGDVLAPASELLRVLRNGIRAYVVTLENGHDRIRQLGGECDSVEQMEASDPWLRNAKAAVAMAESAMTTEPAKDASSASEPHEKEVRGDEQEAPAHNPPAEPVSSEPSASATSSAAASELLMRFYGVQTLEALVEAQAYHIEKLQAKLPPAPSLAPQRVREG